MKTKFEEKDKELKQLQQLRQDEMQLKDNKLKELEQKLQKNVEELKIKEEELGLMKDNLLHVR